MISWAAGNGWTALCTYLLSFVKSVTILTLLVSFFPTKKAGLHHSVGVETGTMTFLSSKSCTAFAAGVSILLGMTLAVVTLHGTITPSLRYMCMGAPAIGVALRLSWMMSLYSFFRNLTKEFSFCVNSVFIIFDMQTWLSSSLDLKVGTFSSPMWSCGSALLLQ